MNRQIAYKLRTGQAKIPIRGIIPKGAKLINGEYYVIDDNCTCFGCAFYNIKRKCTYYRECKLTGLKGYKKV